MNTTTNKIRFSVIGILLGTVFTVPVAIGGDLTVTKTWSSGNTLTAQDLNNNFNDVEAAVNDNDSRITQNKSVSKVDRTICGSGSVCPSDTLTTTASTVTSVTINAPSSGKVIVSFSGQYNISHANGAFNQFCVEIGTDPSAAPTPACNVTGQPHFESIDASHRLVTIPENVSTNTYQGSIHSQQVFSVKNAGSHTYYLRGQSNSAGTNIHLRQSNMIAYFIAD